MFFGDQQDQHLWTLMATERLFLWNNVEWISRYWELDGKCWESTLTKWKVPDQCQTNRSLLLLLLVLGRDCSRQKSPCVVVVTTAKKNQTISETAPGFHPGKELIGGWEMLVHNSAWSILFSATTSNVSAVARRTRHFRLCSACFSFNAATGLY